MAPKELAPAQENDVSGFSSNLAVDAEIEGFFSRLGKKTTDLDAAKRSHAEYDNYWRDKKNLASNDEIVEERVKDSATITNLYYDLATDFYEYGWGDSFHFGRMFKNSGFQHNLNRHEDYLALKLNLKPNQHVLDVGCGVGGPLREIARFSGAHVTGLNNNAYQVGRARKLNKRLNVDTHCKVVKGSFNEMPFPEGVFDAAYAIEACCHASQLEDPYGEVFRTLKPGGLFACYEWLTTDKYDENDLRQKKIVHAIEEGDGIAKLRSVKECNEALTKVGFEILEAEDLASPDAFLTEAQDPWYQPLKGQYSLDITKMRMTPVGRSITHVFVNLLETVGFAPPGTVDVSNKLIEAAVALTAGGEEYIFTPMYFFLARKPL